MMELKKVEKALPELMHATNISDVVLTEAI